MDCPDPVALAAFYERATGYAPHPGSDADFAGLLREDGLALGFQRVDDYTPPRWPDPTAPHQFHLDFEVPDLAEAETLLLELGATRPGPQPGGERWLVLLDPAGHPFCVLEERGQVRGG
ncbi:VOC family protein [Streptomyces sp. bgisy154]|uniref:VOC family protein n=1 Tax=Streptomyces sp. bgisy154 TaxID=3413794 RepID=UPI003D7552F0